MRQAWRSGNLLVFYRKGKAEKWSALKTALRFHWSSVLAWKETSETQSAPKSDAALEGL